MILLGIIFLHCHFLKQTPGSEIWKDTAGKVGIFVAAVGSGGTLTGVGSYLKMKNPSIKIVCVEPSQSAVISGPEIWKDTAGKVDMFVAAVGSGGTLTGVGRYLKIKIPP